MLHHKIGTSLLAFTIFWVTIYPSHIELKTMGFDNCPPTMDVGFLLGPREAHVYMGSYKGDKPCGIVRQIWTFKLDVEKVNATHVYVDGVYQKTSRITDRIYIPLIGGK